MKKSLLILSLIFALPFGLTSCDRETPITPQSDDATIVIEPTEHATITCSITSLEGKRGDKGTLTITPENEHYRVDSVFQNSIIELTHVSGNHYVYEFTLLRGQNTFTVEMTDYIDIVDPDSPILGPGNELVSSGGELTTPDPLPGHYANEVTIYFKDIQWWNDGEAGVTALFYDENKQPVGENTTLGSLMTHISYNAVGKFNYWTTYADADVVEYVQFFRTDGSGGSDWNARTDILNLPSEDNNMYTITSPSYVDYNKTGEYVQVEEGIYDPSNDPVWTDYGTYTVYLAAPSYWTSKGEDTRCYKFGLNNQSWPGDAMELVSTEGDITYYRTTVDTAQYNSIIFNVSGGGYQTANIALPTEEYGEDAVLLATLPDTEQNTNTFTVTWSTYTA